MENFSATCKLASGNIESVAGAKNIPHLNADIASMVCAGINIGMASRRNRSGH